MQHKDYMDRIFEEKEITKRQLMTVSVSEDEMIQYNNEQLKKLIECYDIILDYCDGTFSANQECILIDMRETFKKELEDREK